MDQPIGDTLASCEYFKTDRKIVRQGQTITNPRDDRFSIVSVVSGQLQSAAGRRFAKGSFLLVPRNSQPLKATEDSVLLQITLPH
jgi:hypothetical protein